MKVVGICEAKRQFSRLLRQVAAGEKISITKRGIPVAQLVPVQPGPGKPKLGFYKGRIKIANDLDGPLPDEMQALFEGREPAEGEK
jgi:prevent-host-death family protein